MHRFLLLVALCMSAPTAYACGLFQDRFEVNNSAGWPACIDVSVDAPDTVSVIAQSGLNDDGQNFSEVTILPDFGHILRRAQVSTDCDAGLVWQNNTVRIEPVTEACDLIIEAPRFSPMPDTGITTCSSENALADCPIDGYPGQDGEHGLDSLDDLIKIGSGAGSRDFTKLDADGEPLPANASNWSCVRDNQTGLVWERKVANSSSIHHINHRFTWYEPNNDVNGGDAGTPSSPDTQCNALLPCDTKNFVTEVNDRALCGRTDWGLPSPTELSSLLSWLSISNVSLVSDSVFFPIPQQASYWSFVPAPSTAIPPTVSDRAFAVSVSSRSNISGGTLRALTKSSAQGALLVSRQSVPAMPAAIGPPPDNACDASSLVPTSPSSAFSVLGDGSIVRDERTGLLWQRCLMNQTWDSDEEECVDPEAGSLLFTWQDALEAASASVPSGWRLPNRHEAITTLELCNTGPPINSQVFPNAKARVNGSPGGQWTSSPNIQQANFDAESEGPDQVWILQLASSGAIVGAGSNAEMDKLHFVRLVRDDVPFTELSVTSSGASAYIIDGASNPALELVRGQSYRFNINASGHPFLIKTEAVTGPGSTFDDGVTNNGAAVGVVQFDVPLDAPDTLFYICQFHGAMQGQINIIDP